MSSGFSAVQATKNSAHSARQRTVRTFSSAEPSAAHPAHAQVEEHQHVERVVDDHEAEEEAEGVASASALPDHRAQDDGHDHHRHHQGREHGGRGRGARPAAAGQGGGGWRVTGQGRAWHTPPPLRLPQVHAKMSRQVRRIVVVAPGRDESRFMRRTLDSLARQTLAPALIVVVDDGSTDATPEVLAEYEQRVPHLRVVRRPNRGERSVGPGVIEAFYAGLETVKLDEFDYVCKLDLDLDLPDRYFESLVERMEADPRLGTCSGKPYYPHPRTGELVSEGCGDDTSIGASKFYRVDCFRQIGGFVRHVMWDGIDAHRCRMLGWKAASWDDPALRFI